MSQIWFKTTTASGTPVRVLTGYDRPLGHFFYTVFNPDSDSEDEVLHSSMGDPESLLGGYSTPEAVMEKLTVLGISIPKGDDWLRIINLKEGNKHIRYYEDAQVYG